MSLRSDEKKKNVIEKLNIIDKAKHEFYLVRRFENSNNIFMIEFQDLNIEKIQEIYLVFFHEKGEKTIVFPCRKKGQQVLEADIDDSLLATLDNPYELHKWNLAIAYDMAGIMQLKFLKASKKDKKKSFFFDMLWKGKQSECDISYRNEIDLYTGRIKKNKSEVDLDDYIIEIIPLLDKKGFLKVNTIAKFLCFYRDQQFGIFDFFTMDSGFRLRVCLPEYFTRIEKICVIPRGARQIEIGKYELNYKVEKQEQGNLELDIDINPNINDYYADKWSVALFLNYNGQSFICPLIANYKKICSIRSEAKNYKNHPVELQIEVEKNGAFSFECKIDSYYEKSFLYRYAQVLEETDQPILELIKQNKLKELGKINAKMEIIQENQLSIQLISETLVRCLDTNIVFINEKKHEILVGKITFFSETKGAVIVEYPNLKEKFMSQSDENWKICMALKRNELYYVLRVENSEI